MRHVAPSADRAITAVTTTAAAQVDGAATAAEAAAGASTAAEEESAAISSDKGNAASSAEARPGEGGDEEGGRDEATAILSAVDEVVATMGGAGLTVAEAVLLQEQVLTEAAGIHGSDEAGSCGEAGSFGDGQIAGGGDEQRSAPTALDARAP